MGHRVSLRAGTGRFLRGRPPLHQHRYARPNAHRRELDTETWLMKPLWVLLGIAIALVFAIGISPPASAATNHYLKLAPIVCADPNSVWSNADCWSLSSGGAPGGGVPAPGDDIIVDDNSVSGFGIFAYDGTSVIRDISITLTEQIVINSFDPDSTLAGSCGDPGLCFSDLISYVGDNDFGTARYTTFEGAEAVGETIYCDPGCVDAGGNVNIVFGPAPSAPAAPQVCTLNAAIPGIGIVGFTVILIGIALLALVVGAFLVISSKTASRPNSGYVTTIVGSVVGVIVLLVVTGAVLRMLSC